MIETVISNVNNIFRFIDKILQGNLYVNMTAAVTSWLGIVKINYANLLITREDFVSVCLTISAATGAIYGLYRVGDLIYKCIKKIKSK